MRIALALAAVAALALAVSTTEQALGQSTVAVAIDVDVSGNGPRDVGPIDTCRRIDSSNTKQLQIDVVLPAPGIPADVGIKGWQFDLLYDKSVVNVTDEDTDFLLTQAKGSDLFAGLSDPLPDSDGSFTSAAADFATAYQIEPKGAQEVGPGVITRITLSVVSKGTTNLTLANIILGGADGNPMPLGTISGAAVSVDTPCQPPPSPVPAAAAGSPTAGAQTPLVGTPGSGPADNTPTPGAGAAGTETPGASTPGPGTPVLGGTPTSGATRGEAQGTSGSDGGGLSAAAWAGIGVGIAAAALAASGTGWFVLRRRKAKG
jgi:hypothetical protein